MEERLPQVLIAAPTSEEKDYCFPRWAEMVRSLSYPNYNVILIDNSEDKNYCNTISEAGILCNHIDREGKSAPEYITMSLNMIREYFLQSKMDFLLILETDVFVPQDIIEKMIMHRKPVLNITYFYKYELDSSLCFQAVTKGEKMATSFQVGKNVGFHVMDGTVKLLSDMELGADMQMVATGIGCTMIHRNVMEEIEFRIDKRNVGGFADSYFHLDLLLNNIPNWIDTSIVLEHDRRNWRSNLEVWK